MDFMDSEIFEILEPLIFFFKVFIFLKGPIKIISTH